MTRSRYRRSQAFTLAELLMVILVLGLLAIFAVVQYFKTVEVGRADQAINALQQIASAHHMYTLNVSKGKSWPFPPGPPNPSGPLGASCNDASTVTCANGAPDNNGCCGVKNNGGPVDACDLVRCNFLPKRDWRGLSYNLLALDPKGSAATWSTNCGFTVPPVINNAVACGHHKPCISCGGTETTNCSCNSKFKDWAYVIDSAGAIFAINNAPAEEGATVIAPPPPPAH